MKMLVAGAAGFIGSHLVDRLLRDGHEVLGIDDYLTGSAENLSSAREYPSFTFVEADICAELPPCGELDVIFHLASPASPFDYAAYPVETMRVNSIGTDRLCRLASARGARVVYASTSEIYGDPLEHPQREEYFGNVNTIGPRACYDESKRFGEALIATYRRRYGLDARIARIFNTYGPRMRRNDGRVVPAFVGQALAGEPMTVFGDGEQTRSLCYVDDLVDGLVAFATAPELPYFVLNLGNDHEVTVLEIASEIARSCAVPLNVEYRQLPQDDPKRRRPDLRRAREALRWQPRTPLREGLSKTIAFFTATMESII